VQERGAGEDKDMRQEPVERKAGETTGWCHMRGSKEDFKYNLSQIS